MVVWAGVPRAGSTLTMKIGEEAVKGLGLGAADNVHLGYWRFNRHVANSKMPAEPFNLQTILSSIPKHVRVVQTKSHEFDSDILKVCTKTLVITTTRDPVQLLSSAVGASWVKQAMGNCGSYLSYLDGVLAHGRCWQQYSGLHFNYAQLIRNKAAVAMAIQGKIAELLDLDVSLNLEARFSSFKHLTSDANPNIPSSALHDFDRTLSDGCSPSVLRTRYAFLSS